MPSRNSFPGYVKIPGKQLSYEDVRFDFNFRIESEPEDTSLRDFVMRMFVLQKSSQEAQPEIAVSLTAEQWLDLIESMQREYNSMQKIRKALENLDPPE